MAINLNRSRRKKKMTVVTGGSANLTKREPMARETVGWIAGRRRWQHRGLDGRWRRVPGRGWQVRGRHCGKEAGRPRHWSRGR